MQDRDFPLLDSSYHIIRKLGHGAGGDVFLASSGSLKFALKITESESQKRALQEPKILHYLGSYQHCEPYILCYFDSIVESSEYGFRTLLATEYYPGRTLDKVELTSENAKKICRKLWRGLKAIHSTGIAHNDLNRRNIILFGEQVVFIDFGYSCALTESLAKELEIRWCPETRWEDYHDLFQICQMISDDAPYLDDIKGLIDDHVEIDQIINMLT